MDHRSHRSTTSSSGMCMLQGSKCLGPEWCDPLSYFWSADVWDVLEWGNCVFIDTAACWNHVAYAYGIWWNIMYSWFEARQDSICTYKCQSLDPLLALLLVQMSWCLADLHVLSCWMVSLEFLNVSSSSKALPFAIKKRPTTTSTARRSALRQRETTRDAWAVSWCELWRGVQTLLRTIPSRAGEDGDRNSFWKTTETTETMDSEWLWPWTTRYNEHTA